MIAGNRLNAVRTRRTRFLIQKYIGLGMLMLGLFIMALPMTGYAAEADITARIEALKIKFPEGKYWNHVGSAVDNSNGWTETPCSCHNTGVCIAGSGNCTCNHYYDSVQTSHNQSTQCMGFANKLGYDVFGATTWYVYSSPNAAALANIKVGDIIRYSNHSVFVIAKSGSLVTVGEANYTGKCKISWTRVLDLNKITVTYYEHADNYDTIVGGELTEPGNTAPPANEGSTDTTTEEPTTELPISYTGWQKAEDGVHYRYLKKGVVQKKKWVTVSKKKYYLDKNGYRVTGLYNIGSKKYYFNTKGQRQKNKWVCVNSEYYYIGSGGYALKSQWLYKGNTLVYVTKDGSVAKSELVKIGRNTYCFDSKGKRGKGFKKCKGRYYYCNKWGMIQKKKWITKSGKKYYLQKSGERAQNKLIKIGKYRYYFNTKGQLIKNRKIVYKGKIYKADKSGHCKFIQYEVSQEESTESL